MDNIWQSTIDVIKRFVIMGSSTAQNGAQSPILVKSYAGPLVRLSGCAHIDDRKNHLVEILEDYAANYEKASLKDRYSINAAIVGLTQKMTVGQDPNTAAQDIYYKCVNGFPVPTFDTSPELIHNHLLREKPQYHPRGISSIAFSFAALLALTLHREDTSQSDLRNTTSPYFDLSPLYGTNETETNRVRLKDGSGMLWPDCFAEERLAMLPDSVPVLLVLWNRYHNYVAKQLFSRNEHDKWKDPAILSPDDCWTQDDEIFHVARSITCINFMNVIQEDFVRGLIGLPMAGPSARLDVLNDIRGLKFHRTGYLSSVESYFLYSFSPLAPPSLVATLNERTMEAENAFIDPDIRRRNNIGNVGRNKHDRFDDNDLAELLFNATEMTAGSPGGGAVPEWAREQEILKLEQARRSNLCTLNEFRRHLGLKPLTSFEEWNPKLANVARDLYEDINKLELYPGLLCECSTGSGFGFGYTMTWGLIADIVTRIRCDPMFTSKFNEQVLTKWGYKDCTIDDANESNLSFYSTRGSLGGRLPKLFQRTLPHNYTYDNIYCLFPFVVPQRSQTYVQGLPEADRKKYKTNRPRPVTIKTLRSLTGIREALNDPETFASPYKQNIMELTDGYGHMLGFDDLQLHDSDLMLTLLSLMPDKGAARRTGAYFFRKAQENLKHRTLGRGKKDASIDVVKDVIGATCIRWVCETICGVDFPDRSTRGMTEVEIEEARKKSREMEQGMHEDFAAYYAYILPNVEPEFGWNTRERALSASKRLHNLFQKKLTRYKNDRSDAHYVLYVQKTITSWWQLLNRIKDEYVFGTLVPRHSAFTFLDQMVKTSQMRPLKRLADTGHLLDLKKKYMEGALNGIVANESQTLEEASLSALSGHLETSEYRDAEEIARQRLEVERMISNAIGLSVVISMKLSKACAQVVDFYLDDRYAKEKEALVALCKDPNSSNGEIMGYIWEAQRIQKRFGIWRNANLSRTITQGFGYPDVLIESGDRVFADFSFAHNDVVDPEKVDPNRKTNSLLGLGVHKCPAGSFISQTMSQMIRVIFRLEGLRRVEGNKGRLKSAILHPDPAPWHPEVYLCEDGGFSRYPTQMVIESKFDASNWKEESIIYSRTEHRMFLLDCKRSVLVTVFLFLWLFMLSFFVSPFSDSSTARPRIISCNGPFPPVDDWHIRTFRPRWFGVFGEPAPIVFQTPSTWGPWKGASHRISVVDIDKRDIEIRVRVDGEDRGHRDVELDPNVDCGEDIAKCLELRFAAAVVVVPPGKHTVKAEIRKRKASEAFVWGNERWRRIMWTMQQCN